jgi:predicted RNA binding protein YcfA (HicA-like mRNA interferase family)
VAKARRVLAALLRDGWVVEHQVGSHRKLRKNGVQGVFFFHDKEDLGSPALARVAREFGYTVDELRRMI